MTASLARAPEGKIQDLPPLREVIAKHELIADKRLGQNFILDFNLLRRIARAAGGDGTDAPLAGRSVIEIGPGPGGLTRALLMEGADHVLAVERDPRCLPALAEIADASGGRLTVVAGDAMSIDWAEQVRRLPSKPVIVANLPYNIATQLLIGWLETTPWPPWFSGMALMFQKEVAERIVAEPDAKAYGRLSVISQWRCETRMLFTLRPEAFTPPPKVESAVVLFKPRAEPLPACDVGVLGRVTAAAFGQRRKMLRQSLKTLTPMPELLLAETGIDGMRRAETLSVTEFATLAATFGRLSAG